MKETIERIIDLEWAMFTEVDNVGGRADCQDDLDTFRIMRRSQFEAWDARTLESYLDDLRAARENGRNLVAMKYGYMMEFSFPEEYASVRDKLPPVSGKKRLLAEGITAIHLAWRAELLPLFPHVFGQGRPELVADEADGFVSAESYSMGELQSMSERTLERYDAYARRLASQNRNMARMILENLVGAYGFPSLDAAEKRYSAIAKEKKEQEE
jgi:hypothetical protein